MHPLLAHAHHSKLPSTGSRICGVDLCIHRSVSSAVEDVCHCRPQLRPHIPLPVQQRTRLPRPRLLRQPPEGLLDPPRSLFHSGRHPAQPRGLLLRRVRSSHRPPMRVLPSRRDGPRPGHGRRGLHRARILRDEFHVREPGRRRRLRRRPPAEAWYTGGRWPHDRVTRRGQSSIIVSTYRLRLYSLCWELLESRNLAPYF